MRSYLSIIAGFAFLAFAILFTGDSAQRQRASLTPVPLPVGENVEISVEPSEPTGKSLEVVSGNLAAADELWVFLIDSRGREAWIPRDRVAIIRVHVDG